MRAKFLNLIVFIALLAGESSGLEFIMPIHAYSGTEDTTAYIGVSFAASNDFDSLDFPSLGFPPSFVVQFEHPGSMYGALVRDIRSASDTIQLWDGSILNAPDVNITLQWDIPDIPPDSASLEIWSHAWDDTLDTSWTNMLETDSIVLSSGERILIRYRYFASAETETTTIEDTIPPEVVEYSIEDGDTITDPAYPFVAVVVDTGSGIAPSTLVFNLNGMDLSYIVTDSTIGDTTIFTYTPTFLPYGPENILYFGVSDNAGNWINDTIVFYYSLPDTGDTTHSDSLFTVTCMVMLSDLSTDLSGSVVEILDLDLTDTTDMSGQCVFDSIPMGVHEFKAHREGYMPVDTFVNIDSSMTVMFVLTPYDSGAFVVSGTVELEGESEDLSGSVVKALGVDSVAIYDTTDATGYYELTLPLFGSYMIIAEHNGYHPDTVLGFFYTDTVVNFSLSRITGIAENKSQEAEKISVSLDGKRLLVSGEINRVQLYDVLGKLMIDIPAFSKSVISVPVGNLKSGIYLVRVLTPHGETVDKIAVIK